MGDYPTDLLGWADEMDRSADGCREAGFPQVVEEGNRFLAKLLRQAAAENAALRERVAVLERVYEAMVYAAEGCCDPQYSGASHDNLRYALEWSRKAIAAAKPAAQEGKEQP